VKLEVRKLI